MLSRYNISQSYMAEFSENPPHPATLHWDGKMLRDVLDSEPGTTSETLAVLVSGPPAYPEGKLVRVPVIDSQQKPPRADYKEMAELTVIVLGRTPPRGIHWSRPGAIHQARGMARNLYSMKMLMFCDQLKYDEETVTKLERLNIFLALFYTPPEKEDYKKALEYVRNLRVVNDIAERGVKMMSDFANVITTDPKQREYLFHAVEYNRQRFESFKKQTLNE
ncbi:hypothetical protein O3P69_004938 [Scylla paramamosain]|uniref:Uncharacterized protein n=1 Tax=Scylla paramamosain TaxID=85552 RepID=A0AAW0U934_SCYPA